MKQFPKSVTRKMRRVGRRFAVRSIRIERLLGMGSHSLSDPSDLDGHRGQRVALVLARVEYIITKIRDALDTSCEKGNVDPWLLAPRDTFCWCWILIVIQSVGLLT